MRAATATAASRRLLQCHRPRRLPSFFGDEDVLRRNLLSTHRDGALSTPSLFSSSSSAPSSSSASSSVFPLRSSSSFSPLHIRSSSLRSCASPPSSSSSSPPSLPPPPFVSSLAQRRRCIRDGATAVAAFPQQRRHFSAYEGQTVEDADLIKKDQDWVIEETNFCLGRVAGIRFKETDDLAHRVLHLMECQLPKMHTRLRDGTCIPYTGLYLSDVLDKPSPMHIFQEMPLLKWTWDETYDEAYEDVPEEGGRSAS